MTSVDTPDLIRSAATAGLISTRRRDALLVELSDRDPADAADVMVRGGWLTRYQSEQLLAGRTRLHLGPYIITDFLGQGGMGRVFRAVHRFMGRTVAVKVLPLEKHTPDARDSFIRETRLQAGLDHPHVVRALDAGRDGNVPYLVTELVPGTDLRSWVRRGGPLAGPTAATLLRQVAEALAYLHSIDVLHRDVKPGNILVTPDGVAKLSDIGLATIGDLATDPRGGKVVGTADYLSPEQIRTPGDIGPASDLYSLGCTAYYAVTGKVPFPGGDTASKCQRHLNEAPWHPGKFAGDLDAGLTDLIADLMEKDVSRRLSTAAGVIERLDRYLADAPEVDGPFRPPADVVRDDRPSPPPEFDVPSSTPPRPPRRKRNDTLPAITLTIAVTLPLGLAIGYAWADAGSLEAAVERIVGR